MLPFWKFFLDNKAFTYFLVFLTLISGTYAILSIPKESTPEITIPIVVVQTPFFGASAQDVETLVTNKIEDSIATVSDIKEYTSTSQPGFSSVVIEFEQQVDIDERVTKVKDAVDRIKGELPSDGNDPAITKVEFSKQPVFTVSLVSNLPYYSLQKVVDELEDKIMDISGVAEVTYYGIPEREVAVTLDNRALVQQGIDYQTVLGSLGGTNISQPVGSIVVNNIEYPLDLEAEVQSFEVLEKTPIGQSGVSSLLVSDLGLITNGYKPKETNTRVGFPGQDSTSNSVTINITKKQGGDITVLTQDIRDLLAEEEATTLKGIDTVVTYDAGKDIRDDLGNLSTSGLQTVILVLLVLMATVGFRESIIAAIAIPMSFMLAFVAFLFVGNTINFISLFSLILAVGILVDTTIVVIEGIDVKIKEGLSKREAALSTIKEFGVPLIAGNMTTVAVFFPLLFLSGVMGQFIAGIPYTVIFVLLASLFIALSFVTVFCVSFLKDHDHLPKESYVSKKLSKLEAWYERYLHSLTTKTKKRRLTQGIIIAATFVSFGLIGSGIIKAEFFPGGDIEYAFIEIEMPQGTSINETNEYTKQVEAILLSTDYLDSFVTTIGESSSLSGSGEVSVGDRYANITLNIKKERQSEGEPLLEPARSAILEKRLFNADLVTEGGGPPTGLPIEIQIESDNTEALRLFARQVEDVVNEEDGTKNVSTTLPPNNSGFTVLVDRNAAYRYGVSLSAIATTIIGATDGVELFEITENGEDVPVVVRNKLNYTDGADIETKYINPEMITQLQVMNNRGQLIMLGSLVSIELSETDSEISHRDGTRVVTVSADLDDEYNANDKRTILQKKLDEIKPEGVEFVFGGEAAEQDQSFAEVGIAFLAGIFLMFAILILQFGRWRQTFLILSVVPFALAGVLIGLFVTGSPLSFPVMLGLVALSGIVVNNSIILISVFNQLREKNPAMSLDEVVIQGSTSRLRPIILTSITTIIGAIPLLFSSAIWAPIAYTLIFGLTFCVLITLIMVPLIYRRFEGFRLTEGKHTFSWFLTVGYVIILPLIVAVIAATALSRLSGNVALGIFGFAVLMGIGVYIATHIRASEHRNVLQKPR